MNQFTSEPLNNAKIFRTNSGDESVFAVVVFHLSIPMKIGSIYKNFVNMFVLMKNIINDI